ncbi:recombinase family protein [Fulvivirgaceae bacterium PWU5]|uniref:Recombinase family protein n=1 Tax=Dawidia cretensis TaxID=2782350 RepID=A0AAP2GX79_9BACT|nr:recombinase family protein [Dawidia cretensis]MBT1712392.1 recombinase family protein [Dawidia cretensis]
MKLADIYIRVSTDEQAERGYSQRSQEELLRKYCDLQNISIRHVVFEDHSAKTFERPAWKKYLTGLAKHKGQSALLLFLKWDRFSRNAGDAYQMINRLRKLGIEPQAIEQPLDLSVPENKMMLAFYLAAPEVENDRRALNVIHGMRRARKEGRYMGLAPIGYVNKTDEQGRKYIAPAEPHSNIVTWLFHELANGLYNAEQVFKMAIKKGFSGSKSLFWKVIRNPVYCGKIYLPGYKEEEPLFVAGEHQPLVSEAVFDHVQEVLDGRKRKPYRAKISSHEDFPLRGFLMCPQCGQILTASTSKGCRSYYAYYHCRAGCGFRVNAHAVNDAFVKKLSAYKPRKEVLELFKLTLLEAWEKATQQCKDESRKLNREAQNLRAKMTNIRDLLASGDISPEEFREMKSNYGPTLESIECRLSIVEKSQSDIDGLIIGGVDKLLTLGPLYESLENAGKRQILNCVFPDKLTFDSKQIHISNTREVVNLLYL